MPAAVDERRQVAPKIRHAAQEHLQLFTDHSPIVIVQGEPTRSQVFVDEEVDVVHLVQGHEHAVDRALVVFAGNGVPIPGLTSGAGAAASCTLLPCGRRGCR